MEWIINDFKKESGIDLSHDNMAKQRLKEAAEKAKSNFPRCWKPKSICPSLPPTPPGRSTS